MTLDQVRELIVYMLREAYSEGNRDGLRMANRIESFLEVDPEMHKLIKDLSGESK